MSTLLVVILVIFLIWFISSLYQKPTPIKSGKNFLDELYDINEITKLKNEIIVESDKKLVFIENIKHDPWNNDKTHKLTGSKYDFQGFDINGFDRHGYNREGYDKNNFDRNGFNSLGIHSQTNMLFDKNGYDKNGYDKNGFNKHGINLITNTSFDSNGYDKHGFDTKGFDNKGMHKTTGTKYNNFGYDKDGFNLYGYDKDGYGKDGFNKNGFDCNGLHIDTNTTYNDAGFDKSGYDKNGYDKNGLNRVGMNRSGYFEKEALKSTHTNNYKNSIEKYPYHNSINEFQTTTSLNQPFNYSTIQNKKHLSDVKKRFIHDANCNVNRVTNCDNSDDGQNYDYEPDFGDYEYNQQMYSNGIYQTHRDYYPHESNHCELNDDDNEEEGWSNDESDLEFLDYELDDKFDDDGYTRDWPPVLCDKAHKLV